MSQRISEAQIRAEWNRLYQEGRIARPFDEGRFRACVQHLGGLGLVDTNVMGQVGINRRMRRMLRRAAG